MRSRVCVTVRCPSVCLSHSLAAAACAGFAAVGPAVGNIDRLLHGRRRSSTRPQHGAQQQMRAVPRLPLTYEAELVCLKIQSSLYLNWWPRDATATTERNPNTSPTNSTNSNPKPRLFSAQTMRRSQTEISKQRMTCHV